MTEKKQAEQYSLFFIQRFKGKVLFNVPMSDYTSFRIGGPADVVAFPKDDGDLKDIVSFAESKGFPYYILGGGTNVLVRDGGVRGIVIVMIEGFKHTEWEETASGARAVVGAGVSLVEMVGECRERGLTGMEFAVSIPGTVGGAVLMNAGAYGGEMKDVVEGVEVMNRKGQKGFMPKGDIGFSYRSSNIPKGNIVMRAHMAFKKGAKEEIKNKMSELREKRKTTGKIPHPNAGSVFKNPEGLVAGKLIEEAGLKGETSGNAQISDVHGNYIVNLGGAAAKDVLSLMALMRDRIYRTKGITLEPEIKVIGEG